MRSSSSPKPVDAAASCPRATAQRDLFQRIPSYAMQCERTSPGHVVHWVALTLVVPVTMAAYELKMEGRAGQGVMKSGTIRRKELELAIAWHFLSQIENIDDVCCEHGCQDDAVHCDCVAPVLLSLAQENKGILLGL
uniref:Uncharacterized protein n=1 Tax=Hyaloperonospora arabidopsidis (strain Emoy2) TaxID=559515 RepID=M4BNN5_HYAAE